MTTIKPGSVCIVNLLVILLAVGLTNCGSSQASTKKTSGLKKRVLVSNTLGNVLRDRSGNLILGNGAVDIMDASTDTFVSRENPFSDLSSELSLTLFIPAVGAAGMSTGGGVTAVINANGHGLSLIDNGKEEMSQAVNLSHRVEDVAVSPDGKNAYAAVRNGGQVAIVSTADGGSFPVPVPLPRRLVLSPKGTRLLVFPDEPQLLPAPQANAFFVIDTAARTATPISLPGQDHPVFGVFNGSETQAFILNCGAECAGVSASVMLIDFSGAPAVVASVPVSAATIGLLSGNNLYVAGTPPGLEGRLHIINTGAMTASAPITITDGHHGRIGLAADRLYVGANACTPAENTATGRIRGCLTIFNLSARTASFPEVSSLRGAFDVTGITPIAGRNVVYVCQGGELDIFDMATDAITNDKLDAVGVAVDAVQIDP
jgi:hypothetical protein